MVDEVFWRDVVVNLLPDVAVAIVFGIFIALYFQKKETSQELEEGRTRILSLIKAELQENVDEAKVLLEELEKSARIGLPGVRFEIWDTFRSSGDLRWLAKDLNLLNALARGYHAIKAVAVYEKHYLDALLLFENSETRDASMNGVRQHLMRGYRGLIAAVGEFLENPSIKIIDTEGFTKPVKYYDGIQRK